MLAGTHPILSCEAARELETRRFGGDEAAEWGAMQQAGHGITAAMLRDAEEIGGLAPTGRVLVLVGKGHNGGDALIAADALLQRLPATTAQVLFAFGATALRPLAQRAWRELAQRHGARVQVLRTLPAAAENYEVCLDGVFGFQFRPPVDPGTRALLEQVNALSIRLRVAVDLPSADLFRADFTYATGSVKAPALASERTGRLRYVNLGFFSGEAAAQAGALRVLTPEVLAPLRGWRSPLTDKRTFGHVFVLGGSRSYPGAALMAVLAALRSGVGLVSGFVPETLVPAFAARVPEAIWIGWPETPDGGLALEGESLLRERLDRATALVIGPGIGREPETQALVTGLMTTLKLPVLLDADALQPANVRAGLAPRVLTPHAGEFARIADGASPGEFAQRSGATLVLKGPVTSVVVPGGEVYHSLAGGPVLARGGSGDVLAGLIGGLLAQTPHDPLAATARGVTWHGLAADALARSHGQVAARTTELIDALPAALRHG